LHSALIPLRKQAFYEKTTLISSFNLGGLIVVDGGGGVVMR